MGLPWRGAVAAPLRTGAQPMATAVGPRLDIVGVASSWRDCPSHMLPYSRPNSPCESDSYGLIPGLLQRTFKAEIANNAAVDTIHSARQSEVAAFW